MKGYKRALTMKIEDQQTDFERYAPTSHMLFEDDVNKIFLFLINILRNNNIMITKKTRYYSILDA